MGLKDFFKDLRTNDGQEAEVDTEAETTEDKDLREYGWLSQKPITELSDDQLVWLIDYIRLSAADDFSAVASGSGYAEANMYQQERLLRAKKALIKLCREIAKNT